MLIDRTVRERGRKAYGSLILITNMDKNKKLKNQEIAKPSFPGSRDDSFLPPPSEGTAPTYRVKYNGCRNHAERTAMAADYMRRLPGISKGEIDVTVVMGPGRCLWI